MLNWLVPVLKNNVAAKTQLAEGAEQLASKQESQSATNHTQGEEWGLILKHLKSENTNK